MTCMPSAIIVTTCSAYIIISTSMQQCCLHAVKRNAQA
jgi:hypothetical protein